jgi:hypothetical protein
VENGVNTMIEVIGSLTGKEVDVKFLENVVSNFSFENQSKRKPGDEDSSSFLRKGKPGDWKSKFSKEAAIVFNEYAGRELIQLGYEKDSSWIDLTNFQKEV